MTIKKSSAFVQPGRGDVHVDRTLTNVSVAFQQDASAFIADQVFPNIPVQSQTDKYFTFPRGAFNRDEMQLRAPSAESSGANYTLSTDSYSCDVFALHHDIPDQVLANVDPALNPAMEVARFLTNKALIKRERTWASAYFTTSLWTTDLTGVSGSPGAGQFQQWNEAASDPLGVIRTGKRTVQQSTGWRPNKLVLGREVYDKLLDHPDIVSRINGGSTAAQPAIVMRQLLAQLFELDQVLVMDSIYNSAQEGASDSHAFIGGKSALLCYAAPSPGLMTPTAGYTFSWARMGSGAGGQRIKRFRMEELEADRIEIQMNYDQKLVAADLGYFFATAVA